MQAVDGSFIQSLQCIQDMHFVRMCVFLLDIERMEMLSLSNKPFSAVYFDQMDCVDCGSDTGFEVMLHV